MRGRPDDTNYDDELVGGCWRRPCSREALEENPNDPGLEMKSHIVEQEIHCKMMKKNRLRSELSKCVSSRDREGIGTPGVSLLVYLTSNVLRSELIVVLYLKAARADRLQPPAQWAWKVPRFPMRIVPFPLHPCQSEVTRTKLSLTAARQGQGQGLGRAVPASFSMETEEVLEGRKHLSAGCQHNFHFAFFSSSFFLLFSFQSRDSPVSDSDKACKVTSTHVYERRSAECLQNRNEMAR